MVVDGIGIRNNLISKYKEEIINNNYNIKLSIICIGDNEASNIYVRSKKKVCEECNISCDIQYFDYISKEDLTSLINKLNNDSSVTGIMVELPLPDYLDKEEIINLIDLSKDVDGLTKNNLVMPCTALAVLEILNNYNIDINNKNITLVGYSSLIGKPLEKYFISKGINPTICNTKTVNLKENTLSADILISAAGKRNLITKDMVKDNSIIIDCAIIREGNRLYGDTDFDSIKDKVSLITPVPNGVGPITTVMVIKNLIDLYKRK